MRFSDFFREPGSKKLSSMRLIMLCAALAVIGRYAVTGEAAVDMIVYSSALTGVKGAQRYGENPSNEGDASTSDD